MGVFKKSEIRDIERYRAPKGWSALLPPLRGNSTKKPGIKKIGTLRSDLFFSMPGNLVSHRLPNLRTRGSVQSAFLFCCRLLLCVSMAGCSVVGSSPADWGTITQVYLNNLSTVGTLQLNDARSGSHFIKNAPVAFRATLYNFDFIRVRFHSIRSSSSISTRTRL